MNKYEKYKDSGIEWLGEIPEHWESKRLKSIFVEIADTKSTGNETLLTVSHLTGVTRRSDKDVNMFMAESMEGYKKVKEGDLIINTMWAWMGALGVAKEDGICSPAYNVYRLKNKIGFFTQYFNYLFGTRNFIIEMTRFSKGIVSSRLRLYPKDFFRIYTILPSLPEQTAIAQYLDKKTQVIDKKTELLQQKITYYKELRKSIINQAVTKGISPLSCGESLSRPIGRPGVRLKHSGIEWIGQIPEHWEVKRVKDDCALKTGNSISDKENFEDTNNAYYYISTKDINFETGSINYDNGLYIPKSDKSFKIAKGNSTLICIEGANAGKKIGYTKLEICYVNKICAIKSIYKNNLSDKYFFYYSNSTLFGNQFFSIITGLIGGVSINQIKFFDILIPPIQEQTAIANYLDEKTTQIDAIVSNIEQQIEKLAEFRKTLINDVITGKMKVTLT